MTQPLEQSSAPALRRFAETLRAGTFVITSELVPPATAAPWEVLDKALPLRGSVDALNVTDAAGARAGVSSVAAGAVLVRNGIDPIVQMTCRDRNRIALQNDLLGAAVLDVRNIVMMTGDDPSAGDQPDAKPVFDLDTRALLRAAKGMRDDGKMPSGRDIGTAPDFLLGATEAVIDPDAGWTPDRLAAKVADGAEFIQTQFCYDAELLARWIARIVDAGITEQARFVIGIGPLRSAKSARWMREKLGGVAIPDAVVDRLEGAADPEDEGMEICAELMRQYAEMPGIAGVHLMAPANAQRIPETVDRSGLGPAAR